LAPDYMNTMTKESHSTQLNLKQVVAMGVGGMVGGGIFIDKEDTQTKKDTNHQ